MNESELAETVADLIDEALNEIQARTSIPMGIVLVGAHAGLVTKLTTFLGGDVTADICQRAARRVEGIPSMAEVMTQDVLKGARNDH